MINFRKISSYYTTKKTKYFRVYQSLPPPTLCVCCVYVCVCERQREGKRNCVCERETELEFPYRNMGEGLFYKSISNLPVATALK